MKDKIILATLLVFVQLLFSHTYQRDQVARYAHRYTRLTNGYSYGYAPDSLWWNVNPFIYDLELASGAPQNLAGYYDGADCAHFVSQCLQAGYLPMWENNYSDDTYFLGYVNAKNLNNFAVSHFNSLKKDGKNRENYNYCVFYPDSIYLEEVFNPPLESAHPYPDNMHIYKELSTDIMKAKVYFDSLDIYWAHDLEIETASLPDLYFHSGNNGGNFWSGFMGQYNEYQLAYLYISLNVSSQLDFNYGFKLSKMKWRGADTPRALYHKGDFQIFCKYRASSTFEHSSSEIHYENTYNDTGRMIRYRHAAICNAGSGENAMISYHNNDRYNKNFHYYITTNGQYHSIIFYEVPDNSIYLKTPNLAPKNNWGNKPIITTLNRNDSQDISHFAVGDSVYIKYAFQNNGNIMIPDRFKVKVEYGENYTLSDSIFYNGIFADSAKVDTVILAMLDVDSLQITVLLDAGRNRDYGTDWEKTWNDQNWYETNENDNEFSKTIYKGLPKATDVEINVSPNRGTINIQWSGDSDLIYKIYSSTNPYDGFEEDLTGTYNGNSWSAPQPAGNRFYYIIATDGRNSTKSKSIPYLRRKRK